MRTLAFLSLATLLAASGLAAAEALTFDLEAHDSYFTLAGKTEQNPTIAAKAGDSVTVNLVQTGVQPHNWIIDGVNGAKTDFVTTPNQTATATFTVPASGASFNYYCQAHPTTMKGTLSVQSTGGDTGGDDDGDMGDDDKKSPGVEPVGVLAVVGAAAFVAARRRRA